MNRAQRLLAISRRAVSDFPNLISRGIRLIWERSGSYAEALEIAKKRLLIAFFETTDFCNARCIMCGSKYMKRPRQIMAMEIYCRAVEEVAKAKGHSIMLSAFGEPLLDPYIVERVKFASKFSHFYNIGFSTNGSLLTPEVYRRLAVAGLKSMCISIDGYEKETYEKIREGLSFESLQKNIISMLNMHEIMGQPISLSVSSFTDNASKKVKESFLYRKLLEAGIKPILKWRVDNWGGLVSEVAEGLWLMGPPRHKGPCALLYDSSLLVLPDGRVTPCHCRDADGELYIGNVMQNSLEDIWAGKLLEVVRENQIKKMFDPPCAQCSAYISLRYWFTREKSRWLLEYDRRVPIHDRCQG